MGWWLAGGRGEGGGRRGAWGRGQGWLDHGHGPQAHKPTSDDDDDDETTTTTLERHELLQQPIKRTR
jgi:hypothetical protein